ncbi:MAG TPA: putative toxin-antitoxin system toxin component, PIN family [Chitinophagaceae bacterium]|nr:putative toxin-antitoxin system toxin component, PIN family [Chitinophagaceae bacterium]
MPKNKRLNLVIDTNLWISFIISNKLNLLDPLLFTGNVRLIFSEELISEIQKTMAKPKLRKYFGPKALEEMLSAFEPFIDLITVESVVTVCRDAKDNFLLALAKDGKANYLLTGDLDLLDLQKFGKTKIITITNFIEATKNFR